MSLHDAIYRRLEQPPEERAAFKAFLENMLDGKPGHICQAESEMAKAIEGRKQDLTAWYAELRGELEPLITKDHGGMFEGFEDLGRMARRKPGKGSHPRREWEARPDPGAPSHPREKREKPYPWASWQSYNFRGVPGRVMIVRVTDEDRKAGAIVFGRDPCYLSIAVSTRMRLVYGWMGQQLTPTEQKADARVYHTPKDAVDDLRRFCHYHHIALAKCTTSDRYESYYEVYTNMRKFFEHFEPGDMLKALNEVREAH